MPIAPEQLPSQPRVPQPMPESRFAVGLAHLGRQLLLVPEAVLLLGLLCLHSLTGPSPLLALMALTVTLYFGARMALLALSRQAVGLADYERAEGLAMVAARLYPASADVFALRGSIALARGEAGAAVGDLKRAVALFPFQAGLHATLSAALLEAGQPEHARAAAQAALALDPRSAAAHLHLAGADEQLGAPASLVEAQLRAGLALPARPQEVAALRCALAALLLSQGRAAEAQLALAGAEQLLEACPAPQRAGLHYHLGELQRQSGNPDAARGHFSASEAIDPNGRYAAAAWRAARS